MDSLRNNLAFIIPYTLPWKFYCRQDWNPDTCPPLYTHNWCFSVQARFAPSGSTSIKYSDSEYHGRRERFCHFFHWSICLVNLSLKKSTEGSSSCGAAFCIVTLTFPVIDFIRSHPVTPGYCDRACSQILVAHAASGCFEYKPVSLPKTLTSQNPNINEAERHVQPVISRN